MKINLKTIILIKNKLDSTIVEVTEFRSTMYSLNGGLQYEKGVNYYHHKFFFITLKILKMENKHPEHF